MIPVTRTTLPPLEDYTAYLEQIWQTGQVTNHGPLCRQLGDDLAAYLGVAHLELVANGTLALQLAIQAMGLCGEIVTTPYSYVATTNAILWQDCEPVFVDIEPQTFCIDPDLIEAAITEKTSAILATHVYGYPCEVAKIQRIADRYQLKVIYDAAHAFGAKVDGESLMAHGDCSALSFHATKLFHSAEGGALVCRDPAVAQRISLMKRFGHDGEEDYREVGINAKLSELHAAMGLAMLPKVAELIAARRECAGWYNEQLEGCALQHPMPPAGVDYNYAYYPVLFRSPGAMLAVRQALLANGIGPRRYFHPSLNTLPFLKPALQRPCPVSEDAAARILCLPLYAELQKEEIAKICRIVRQALA